MDLRKKTLEEVLLTNIEETGKWNQYRNEYIEVEKNLNEFVKKFEIEVMVPIGSKAYIPGKLYHTNEILVSHFQGYFSKLSVTDAIDIVNHRIKLANDRLKSLENEYKLYKQNLELPLLQEAFTNTDCKEIIEDFDEEAEKDWKIKHKESVRKMKQNEIEQRKKLMSSDTKKKVIDTEVVNILGAYEMIEEIDEEFLIEDDNDKVDDEQLKQLMTGEIQLPKPKNRVSHFNNNIIKKIDVLPDFTNNNTIPNHHDYEAVQENNSVVAEVNEDTESLEDDDDDEDIPDEIKQLLEKVKNLPKKRRIKVLRRKLKQENKFLKTFKVFTEQDLVHKIERIEFQDILSDIIDGLAEAETSSSEEEEEPTSETEMLDDKETQPDDEGNCKQKYKFSEDIKVCYINQMDPPNRISLSNSTTDFPKQLNTLKKIEEQPIRFNPKIDYDPENTIHIKYNHSDAQLEIPEEEKYIIGNPLEIYKKYKGKGKSEKKNKKNTDKHNGEDVGKEAENKIMEANIKPLKSILKNCNLVENETHHKNEVQEVETESEISRNNYETGFDKIMGDVVEHRTNVNTQNIVVDTNRKLSKFKASRKKK